MGIKIRGVENLDRDTYESLRDEIQGYETQKYDLKAMDFDYEMCKSALYNPEDVEWAFIWDETPQGYEFWEGYSSCRSEWEKVTCRYIEYLNKMLFQYDEESRNPHSEEQGSNVNSPTHYGNGRIECIEYIKDFLTHEEWIGYLRGNIAKYMHRWRYKNGVEDLEKAQVYLKWLLETMEENDHD